MKKFLSFALVAMLIIATVAVSASALTWKTGEGLWVHEGADYGSATATKASPVVLTNVADTSVTVEQGGYWKAPYTNGGVWTNEAIGLDGLSVEINFEKAPIATNDCWFAIHLLDKGTLFSTDGNTLGYKNLIRFADPKMEYYVPAWGGNGASEVGANDGIFAIVTGDKLVMDVKYELGQYIISYTHTTGDKVRTFTVPAEKTLDASKEVFNKTGKAHLSVCGSLLGAESDWKYTINVTEGVGLTDEQIAAQEFEQGKGTAKAAIDGYAVAIEAHKATALTYLEGKAYEEDTTIMEALAALDTAIADVAAAQAELVEAADADAVAAAQKKAEDAKAAASGAEATVEQMAEMLADAGSEEPADETVVEGKDDTKVETKEPANIPWLWIGVGAAVVVVIIIIVAVVLGKKKKA